MKRLKLSPEKGSASSVSPLKLEGDYFSSILTDSEEEEGDVNCDGPGGLSLIFSPQYKRVRAMPNRESLQLTDSHPQF